MWINIKEELFLLKESIIELCSWENAAIDMVRLLEEVMYLKIERVGLVHRLVLI